MKRPWTILLAIIFAVIIAIFAVINAHPVHINYLFGTADWPLVLVILGSFLIGGLLIFSMGLMRYYKLQRLVKSLKQENQQYQDRLQKDDQKEKEKPTGKTGQRAPDKEDSSRESTKTTRRNQSSKKN